MKRLLPLFICLCALPGWTQSLSIIATENCFGQITTLVASSSLPDTSILSWNWDLNNDGLYGEETGKTVSTIFAFPDTNLVSLKIIRKNGIADSVVLKKVNVNPLPNVNFHTDNLCESKSALYTNQSSISTGAIIQYYWDFDNNGVIDDAGQVVNYDCGPAQTYVTKLECITDKGCSAFATKTTQVFKQPIASFTLKNTCLGDSTFFTNTSFFGGEKPAYCLWSFGDGHQETNPGNPYHVYDAENSYPVSLIAVSENNCKDTSEVMATIHPLPIVSLEYSGDTVLVEGGSVTIAANGTADNFLWSTGATANSITVSEEKKYSVKATDNKGCQKTLSTHVIVRYPGDSINVLNSILTPNGDGFNDYLLLEDIQLYRNCEISIYNRWNVLVYSDLGYKNNWDGKKNNVAIDSGTYFYFIKCDDKSQVKGSINILK